MRGNVEGNRGKPQGVQGIAEKTFCNSCLKYKQEGKIIVLANKARRFRCSDCISIRLKRVKHE